MVLTVRLRTRIARGIARVLPVLVAAAWLAACSGPPPAAAPTPTSAPAPATAGGQATGTPIKIGYMADANGTSAQIGRAHV